MSDKKQTGIFIPIKVGDIIYTGRFRNRRTTVKTIGVDEFGMPKLRIRRKKIRFFCDKSMQQSNRYLHLIF
jgi:hypothetical protein